MWVKYSLDINTSPLQKCTFQIYIRNLRYAINSAEQPVTKPTKY